MSPGFAAASATYMKGARYNDKNSTTRVDKLGLSERCLPKMIMKQLNEFPFLMG